MAFHELGFLLIFFPVAMILYFAVPKILKNPVLILLSLVFFAWGSPAYVLLLVLLILFNYFTGLQIGNLKEQQKERFAKIVLLSAVIADLLLLGFFKYSGFLAQILQFGKSAAPATMPVGISFFTFSILSFLFDVYRNKVQAPKNILDFALYVSFFPKLVSGPIVPYAEFYAQMKDRSMNLNRIGGGCRLFLVGLAKKLLIADVIGTTFYALTALPVAQVSTLTAWLGALSYTLMLYFDFSGYSDMAIGIAQMCGFTFAKNFDYPYLARGITDFWRRWHISLGAWFREYLYFPLGGSRVDKWKLLRNLLIVWLCTGIWHGASWTFIVWGLYHGALQIAEKFFLKDRISRIPGFVTIPVTFLAVLIGWVFFFAPDLGFAVAWLGRMFGAGGAFLDSTAKFYFASSWPVLVLALLGATPLPAQLGGMVYRARNGVPTALSILWFALLLVLCIAVMTGSTYTSFLYFQF